MRGTYVSRTWAADPALYAPHRYRKACRYDAFVPDRLRGLRLTLPAETANIISEAENAIANLNHASPTHLAPLARLLLRTESIASSKVEGLQVDARSLARAEAKHETGQRIGADALEILASVDAMQLAVERAVDARPLRANDLRDIHEALLGRSTPARAGSVRTVQNWIGGNDFNPCGADFVPPPPEQVSPLLDDLCRFCSDDSLPPLVQAAIAHAQFETIHPFEDGNGRTGRALVQVILRARGLAPSYVPPVSVVLARHTTSYVRGLTLFREDRIDQWLDTFAAAAAQAAKLAARYLHLVTGLQGRWRDQLRQIQPRSDAAAWQIIEVLPAHPVTTIGIAAAATGRTRPAVANALDQLSGCGVLIPLGASPKNKAWEASGLLELITNLEAGV